MVACTSSIPSPCADFGRGNSANRRERSHSARNIDLIMTRQSHDARAAREADRQTVIIGTGTRDPHYAISRRSAPLTHTHEGACQQSSAVGRALVLLTLSDRAPAARAVWFEGLLRCMCSAAPRRRRGVRAAPEGAGSGGGHVVMLERVRDGQPTRTDHNTHTTRRTHARVLCEKSQRLLLLYDTNPNRPTRTRVTRTTNGTL